MQNLLYSCIFYLPYNKVIQDDIDGEAKQTSVEQGSFCHDAVYD